MLKNDIFNLKSVNENVFRAIALELFHFQSEIISVCRQFINNLGIKPESIKQIEDIPFLPVEFFKTNKIYCSDIPPKVVFTSSSTTNTGQSKHYIADVYLYEKSIFETFSYFYGNPADYCFLCLLPSYLERKGSSLIYMAEYLIKKSKYRQSNFYLNNYSDLYNQFIENEKQLIPTIFLGVSFALLNFAQQFTMKLKNTIVMETGGMKGHHQEITRQELHSILCEKLGVNKIHSEYGMTELLSQAFSQGDGIFKTPPWMKIIIYDIHNPLKTSVSNAGGINIIDLANQWSCAFIQTDDIGMKISNSLFKVTGRKDNSEIRGCNLLVEISNFN